MVKTNPGKFPDHTAANKHHVYFQPDQAIRLSYPAIVYTRDRMDTNHANNKLYTYEKRYLITVIDRDPDSKIPEAVLRLPKTGFVGHNRADGLHHDMFATYF